MNSKISGKFTAVYGLYVLLEISENWNAQKDLFYILTPIIFHDSPETLYRNDWIERRYIQVRNYKNIACFMVKKHCIYETNTQENKQREHYRSREQPFPMEEDIHGEIPSRMDSSWIIENMWKRSANFQEWSSSAPEQSISNWSWHPNSANSTTRSKAITGTNSGRACLHRFCHAINR